jgi:hypothetical protein
VCKAPWQITFVSDVLTTQAQETAAADPEKLIQATIDPYLLLESTGAISEFAR